jgi:class 3 adenylate cyclase
MKTQRHPRRLESRPPESAPEEVEVALLFCDVVRSTELTRRLGDRGAYGVIQCFHSLVLRAAAAFGGQELELRGDGVLLAFESPPDAADCAIEIQRGLLELPQGRRVSVRIGVHTGPVLRIASGYFGSNVILSARVAEEAAPGEILASAALVRLLADRNLGFGAGRWVSLKGIPEPNLVFSLPWGPKRASLAEPPCPSPALEALLLTLGRVRESLSNQDEASCMLGQRNAV